MGALMGACVLGGLQGLAEVNKQYARMFPEDDTRLKPLVAGLSTR